MTVPISVIPETSDRAHAVGDDVSRKDDLGVSSVAAYFLTGQVNQCRQQNRADESGYNPYQSTFSSVFLRCSRK